MKVYLLNLPYFPYFGRSTRWQERKQITGNLNEIHLKKTGHFTVVSLKLMLQEEEIPKLIANA